jgi:hypothetical protein
MNKVIFTAALALTAVPAVAQVMHPACPATQPYVRCVISAEPSISCDYNGGNLGDECVCSPKGARPERPSWPCSVHGDLKGTKRPAVLLADERGALQASLRRDNFSPSVVR